jgi:hypothetical protein
MNRFICFIALVAAASGTALGAQTDWSKIDQMLGRTGAVQAAGVHRYGFPRSDLNVTVDGVTIKPGFALGGWFAMLPMGDAAMGMGDLVLTDTEISPVMKSLLENGFQVTAIHNHFLRGSMPVWYMHVGAHGTPEALAKTLHDALALSKTPLTAALPPATPPAIDLDTGALDAAIGFKGTANGGVYQFSVPRSEAIKEQGMDIPPSMGVATALNFQPTGGGKAAITGDFVLLGKEVGPVTSLLRKQGIEVTALHSHMIDEAPRLYFMHFWANDDAGKLAKSLRQALDLTASKHGP